MAKKTIAKKVEEARKKGLLLCMTDAEITDVE